MMPSDTGAVGVDVGTRPSDAGSPDAAVDAWVAPMDASAIDAWTPPPVDAWTPPPVDAWTPPPVDAWTPPPVDAWTPPPVDAWTPPPVDAWMPPPSCAATYGSTSGYHECGSDATSCTFYFAIAGTDDCNHVCADAGGSCIASANNDFGTFCSGTLSASDCGNARFDGICSCSRP